MRESRADILVVEAGVGGVAGALAALEMGRSVILTEEADWIGGQLTSQAVPPDEHPWIEFVGATASYRRLREGIREYYRQHYPLLPSARRDPRHNPGNGWVSKLCHEPRVSLAVLEAMLAPYLTNGQLRLWLRTIPVAVETDGDDVRAVTMRSLEDGEKTVVVAPFVLDATETGDLLELGDIDHVIGAEAISETGEMHALDIADPMDQQAITWCFPMNYHEGEDHTIEKPRDYAFWHDYQADFWPDKQLSWHDVNPHNLQKRHQAIFAHPGEDPSRDFWHYRRIIYAGRYPEGWTTDVTLVNWPQIDYWLGPVVGVEKEERQRHLGGARQLSLSFLYWMQTEAPRHDGGCGYPGLKPRPDLVGARDGLAKHVYIREARRIRAELTVTEEDVGVLQREAMGMPSGATPFHDSVGIGSYRIDLHPSTGNRSYVDIQSWPFQIPLGALIPQRVRNLLPAAKNIGTTHITNGCYRLHPVEWNAGEVAGALAAWCLAQGTVPTAVRNDPARLQDFQDMLVSGRGVEIAWPAFLPPE